MITIRYTTCPNHLHRLQIALRLRPLRRLLPQNLRLGYAPICLGLEDFYVRRFSLHLNSANSTNPTSPPPSLLRFALSSISTTLSLSLHQSFDRFLPLSNGLNFTRFEDLLRAFINSRFEDLLLFRFGDALFWRGFLDLRTYEKMVAGGAPPEAVLLRQNLLVSGVPQVFGAGWGWWEYVAILYEMMHLVSRFLRTLSLS
ncbi:hypothetical protein Syun_001660 [Stephania yunnanensis]|uniref:Uncharacterized protein n=1 Tax=Stephania yunnanensis TaxID=152371 RepID=A0AAP0LF63_9MAGN